MQIFSIIMFIICLVMTIPIFYMIYITLFTKPNREQYIESNNKLKESIEKWILDKCGGVGSSSEQQEFVKSLAACSAAYRLLGDLLRENIEAQEKAEEGIKAGFMTMIEDIFNGLYARRIGLYKEINRLIKDEWKPNRKKIKAMVKTLNIRSMEQVLIDVYNDLPNGDNQIKEIKQWRRSVQRRLNAQELQRFKKMAIVVGGGMAVATVGMFAIAGHAARANEGQKWVNKHTGEIYHSDPRE